MKNILFKTWLLSSLFLALPALADSKVGYVNLEKVFAEATPALKATKKLEKEFAPREEELKKQASAVRALQSQLDKSGLTMAETERKNKERDLARASQDMQRLQREFREDLNARRNEELASLQDKVKAIIQQIASQDKFDLVVQDAVYFHPRADITDRVIKALEK